MRSVSTTSMMAQLLESFCMLFVVLKTMNSSYGSQSQIGFVSFCEQAMPTPTAY